MLSEIKDVKFLCGTDESGAGCLAGPVVASAVILPKDYYHPDLNDSKKMTAKKRDAVFHHIINNAIEYSITEIDNKKIDEINILQARLMAMDLSVKKLEHPEHLLIDGNRFYKEYFIPFETIVQGDGKWTCIAAASVLAKVYRDELMSKLHLKYPQYNWCSNKGYGTKEHYKAIAENGLTDLHRLSFLKNLEK